MRRLSFCSLLLVPAACRRFGTTPAAPFSTQEDVFQPLEVMCEVNGYMIPALIDTGAQISIMSQACAERCMISSSMNSNYGGRAVGVGVSEILGRIPSVSLRVGPVNFINHITILKHSRVDFILGMDFLRKHRCELNLNDDSIKICVKQRQYRIPFLHSYAEVPSSMPSEEEIAEPLAEETYTPEPSNKPIRGEETKAAEDTFANWDDEDDSSGEFVSMEGL